MSLVVSYNDAIRKEIEKHTNAWGFPGSVGGPAGEKSIISVMTI